MEAMVMLNVSEIAALKIAVNPRSNPRLKIRLKPRLKFNIGTMLDQIQFPICSLYEEIRDGSIKHLDFHLKNDNDRVEVFCFC
jgi:uncharacterized protein YlaN (UPF0358 family)